MKITKILSVILAAMMLAFTLVSCSDDEDAPDGYKKISEDSIGYTLYVPNDWESSGPCGAIDSFDKSKVSLMGFDAGDAQTAEECFEIYKDDIVSALNLTDESFIEEQTPAKLGRHDAVEYKFKATISGKEYTFLQIIYHTYNQSGLISRPEAYIFTYTAETVNYDAHIDEVMEMASFVKFDGDK